MSIHMVIKQNTGSAEVRAAGMGAMLLDIPARNAALEELSGLERELLDGALPVGSVEFVRAAMALARVAEPENMSYPLAVRHLMRRGAALSTAGAARGQRAFVKPARTKAFTGFVFDPRAPADPDSRDDLEAFMALPKDEPVWVCEQVAFAGEWRAYVLGSELIGLGRYDPDGADEADEPEKEWIQGAIDAMRASPDAPAACAIDVGRLENGSLALVEVNDAWALGLYGKALAPRVYLEFLSARWAQMRGEPVPVMSPGPRLGRK